jgi:hypothetical protein
MPQITPYLAVEAFDRDQVALLITDAYGHINGRVDLDNAQREDLANRLLAFGPIDVEAVEAAITEEPLEPTDWSQLTKAEIVTEVYERYGVQLDDDLLKSELVAAASEIEEHQA